MVQTYEEPIVASPRSGLAFESVAPQARGGRTTKVLALQALVGRLQHQVHDLERQRRQLSENFNQLDEQIRLASQVQRDLLPESVDFSGLDVHTLYKPLDRVSGDVYDITRLDETHLGISMADVSGHGMPAALLTCLLKRSFRGKEIADHSYEILDPAEVLRRVNQDLLDTDLRQCQFVTGLHAVYYQPARTLTFARGGQPYPLLIRKGGLPKQLVTEGPLIGAFEDARFESMTVYLEPGDAMLLYTDGLEALLLERTGPARFDSIVQTPWFASLPGRSISDALGEIADRLGSIEPQEWPADDVSMIALCVNE